MEIRDAARRRSVLTTAELRGWIGRLSDLDAGVGDAERVDQLRLLEELKGAAAAAQARVTVAFADSQVEADPAQEGRGVAAQVALARRDSPHRGARHVGLAQALVAEMPHTLAALSRGRISEWRATLMVRETAVLSVEDRHRVDLRLASVGSNTSATAGSSAKPGRWRTSWIPGRSCAAAAAPSRTVG